MSYEVPEQCEWDERELMKSIIGDILITFQGTENWLPSRNRSLWREVAKFGKARILITEANEGWRGFPLTTYQDERWEIWVLGEFYGEQLDLPNAVETAKELNGHFIIFAYEHQSRHWHVLTDRFGTVHAYLGSDGKRIALGTFSPAVAGAASAKHLDWDALVGFFNFGFFLGDKTYWQDVHILKPATHLVLDEGGQVLSERKTWNWYHDPDPNLTTERALQDFHERFETVIRDQVGGKAVALPISGGLDSRSTLIPLTTADQGGAKSLVPFSYGYSDDSVETRIARKLAQKRHLEIQTWTIQPYLFDQIERVMANVEGFQDIILCRQTYVVDELAAKASHVLTVHWEDVWFDDMGFLDQPDRYSDSALAEKLVGKFSKRGTGLLLNLFRESLPKDYQDMFKAQIADDLVQFTGIKDLDFKVKAWKTQTWSFRWTLASLRAYQAGIFPLLPFYDHRLTDFFFKLPSEMVRERLLQIEYIKRTAPDLARVTWQAYDANLYNYPYFNSWLLPKRAFKKLGRLLTGKQLIERNWEVQFLNEAGKAGLRQWLLTEGSKLHEFVTKNRIEAFLREFYAQPDASHGYAVSMLLTFSAWLEVYG